MTHPNERRHFLGLSIKQKALFTKYWPVLLLALVVIFGIAFNLRSSKPTQIQTGFTAPSIEPAKGDYSTPALYYFSALSQTLGAIVAIVLAAIYAIFPSIRLSNSPAAEPIKRLLVNDSRFIQTAFLSFSTIFLSLIGLVILFGSGLNQEVSYMLFPLCLLTLALSILSIWMMLDFIRNCLQSYSNPLLLLDKELSDASLKRMKQPRLINLLEVLLLLQASGVRIPRNRECLNVLENYLKFQSNERINETRRKCLEDVAKNYCKDMVYIVCYFDKFDCNWNKNMFASIVNGFEWRILNPNMVMFDYNTDTMISFLKSILEVSTIKDISNEFSVFFETLGRQFTEKSEIIQFSYWSTPYKKILSTEPYPFALFIFKWINFMIWLNENGVKYYDLVNNAFYKRVIKTLRYKINEITGSGYDESALGETVQKLKSCSNNIFKIYYYSHLHSVNDVFEKLQNNIKLTKISIFGDKEDIASFNEWVDEPSKILNFEFRNIIHADDLKASCFFFWFFGFRKKLFILPDYIIATLDLGTMEQTTDSKSFDFGYNFPTKLISSIYNSQGWPPPKQDELENDIKKYAKFYEFNVEEFIKGIKIAYEKKQWWAEKID